MGFLRRSPCPSYLRDSALARVAPSVDPCIAHVSLFSRLVGFAVLGLSVYGSLRLRRSPAGDRSSLSCESALCPSCCINPATSSCLRQTPTLQRIKQVPCQLPSTGAALTRQRIHFGTETTCRGCLHHSTNPDVSFTRAPPGILAIRRETERWMTGSRTASDAPMRSVKARTWRRVALAPAPIARRLTPCEALRSGPGRPRGAPDSCRRRARPPRRCRWPGQSPRSTRKWASRATSRRRVRK